MSCSYEALHTLSKFYSPLKKLINVKFKMVLWHWLCCELLAWVKYKVHFPSILNDWMQGSLIKGVVAFLRQGYITDAWLSREKEMKGGLVN